MFAFGGYEVVPVVAGEARDPRREIPFALLATILLVIPLLAITQVIAMSTLPALASSKTPLADASVRLMGAGGAVMITIGALLSTTGNNMGSLLSGSRNLFALAEQKDLPAFFGRVHPRFRTPVNAILITAAIALVLAVSGTFVTMAAASAISRLIVLLCHVRLRAATARYGRRAGVAPALFRVPLGPVVPAAAMLIAFVIIVTATPAQVIGGAVALAVGAGLFLIAAAGKEKR